jgi:hypothetical protein
MSALQEQYDEKVSPPSFRLDVQLHELLTKSAPPKPALLPSSGNVKFPEPVFPRHPVLLAQDDAYEENLARARAGKRRSTAASVGCRVAGLSFANRSFHRDPS